MNEKIDLLMLSIKTSLSNAQDLVSSSKKIIDEMEKTLEEFDNLVKGKSNETDST